MTDTITIPGYTIHSRLGEGGMAVVYRATQQNREVVLKIMSPLVSSDRSFTTRFVQDAPVIAGLNHVAIAALYEVGEYGAHDYVAMEYFPGGSLRDRLAGGAGGAALALGVSLALASGLEVGHAAGLLHLGIKPENILFREDGTPVLGDFGIARALAGNGALRAAHALVGAPSYMSPESLKGQDVDARADLYSVGIVFHEILTGSPPFDAGSSLLKALKRAGEPLPRLPPGYAHFQEFLDRLTARNREERFASAAEVVQALHQLRAHPGNALPVPQRALRPAPAVVATPAPAAGVSTQQPRPAGATCPPAAPAIPRAQPLSRALQLLPVAAALGCVAVGLTLIVSSVGARHAPRQAVAVSAAVASIRAAHAAEGAAAVASVSCTPPAASGTVAVAPVPRSAPVAAPAAAPPAVLPAALQPQAEARRQRLQEQQVARNEAAAAASQEQTQALEIRELLAAAARQYEAGALWQPAGASAADSYRAILAVRPDQPDALAGTRRIASVLATEADHAVSLGDANRAGQLVQQIDALSPDLPQLTQIRARWHALPSRPRVLSSHERHRLDRAIVQIAHAGTQLDAGLTAAAVLSATEAYDRAVGQEPRAPGLAALHERLVSAYAATVRDQIDRRQGIIALQLLQRAREHGLLSPDLEQLEATAGQ